MYTNQNSADRILNLCKDQKHAHALPLPVKIWRLLDLLILY